MCVCTCASVQAVHERWFLYVYVCVHMHVPVCVVHACICSHQALYTLIQTKWQCFKCFIVFTLT